MRSFLPHFPILSACLIALAVLATLGAPAAAGGAERCVLGELFSGDS